MPGDHDIHVVLVYVSRAFGIYSYIRNYKFTVRSTQALTITAGRPLQLQIVAHEKGGPTTSLEERPAIRFVVGTEGSAEGVERRHLGMQHTRYCFSCPRLPRRPFG